VNNKELALALLKADTESHVITLLKKAQYWDDPNAWRLLGDKDSNYSTIGNQQARPEAALVEKVVNSVDARLLNECLTRGINPESEHAPHSIPHAISVLMDDREHSTHHEGSIGEWGKPKLLDEARRITLSVTGNKPKDGMPSITISDEGEGQSPGRFPDTFLSIDKSNKLRIPFVQGKFNMGGTGALKFCGSNSLQLIISRRNPSIVKTWDKTGAKWESHDPRSDQWGFTIVRRERPSGATGEVRNSVFKYLAPIFSEEGNQILSFPAQAFPLFPKGNNAYERQATYGSAIKLYEYDCKGFGSHALRPDGLLSRLEALLPQIALPVRLHECRNYRGHEGSFANNLVGLSVRLDENKAENLESGYPASASFVVKGEKFTAKIFAFKDNKAESYRTNEGIIFSVNGQTHGSIPKTFFERKRVKMARLSRSLIILVDCSQISAGAREDLFMNSRDRLSNGELRKEIESEMEDIIGKHEGLRELRERRRSEEIANQLSDAKPLADVLDSILKSSPTLSALFLTGRRLSQPNRADLSDKTGGGAGPNQGANTFVSKKHPTYFHFHKKKAGEELRRNAELGRRCRIRFDTDVQNDYFERDEVPGSYEVEVVDGPLDGTTLDHNMSLHDGIANWSISLPEDRLEPGDTLRLQCTVGDDTIPEPFVNSVVVTLTSKTKATDSGKGRRKKNESGDGEGDSGSGESGAGGLGKQKGSSLSGGIDLPTAIRVKRGDEVWNQYSFDDKTACVAVEDDVGYTFYLNVDNVYLKTELKETKEDAVAQEQKFIWGNVLLALALIHDDKSQEQKDARDDEPTTLDKVRSVSRAVAPFLLPMIDRLGGLSDAGDLTAAASGDEE
jgi:hypothetical protein